MKKEEKSKNIAVLWDVMPRNQSDSLQNIGKRLCPTQRYITEDNNLHCHSHENL